MKSSKNKHMRKLARSKLDQVSAGMRQWLPKMPSMPRGGWVGAIRDSLGMTRQDLARRLGVSHTAIAKLEGSERAGTIQLDTLRRAADALDCDVLVFVVPRQPLQAQVDQRRLQLFHDEMQRADVQMNLEDQAMSETLRAHLLQEAEASIPDRVLWREPRS